MTSYQYWQLPKKQDRKDESSLSLKTADDVPKHGADDILVRVHATSLNFRDLIIARNGYPLLVQSEPLVPLSDGAGEVVAVGERVTKFKKGDRVGDDAYNYEADSDAGTDSLSTQVAANFNVAQLRGAVCTKAEEQFALGGAIDGMLSQYVVLPAAGAVRVPQHLSYEEAATLPCAAVTAWNGLFGLRDNPVLPGQTIVCEGTGGVSVFAAQFGIAAGANVVITSSSNDKLEKVRNLFTKEQQERLHTVNYKATPKWDEEVLKVCPDGASHVIEVGGLGTLTQAHNCIKRGGVIVNIGFVAAPPDEQPNVPYLNLISHATYRGLLVGSVEQFEEMNQTIDTFKIKPLVDKVFGFNDAPKAYAHQWSQAHVGKVVVKVQ